MATQAFINNLVDGLNKFSGSKIGWPNGKYTGECTVPVQRYYVPDIIGQAAPSMYGDRADGWGQVFPGVLANFFTHEKFQAGKAYPKGTILMWNSPPASHIAIVVAHDGSNVATVFQQNADPDGSPCHVGTRVLNNQWHTCTYALIPIVHEDAPLPPPYSVAPFTGKLQLQRDSYKYDCNRRDFTDRHSNPIQGVSKDFSFECQAVYTTLDNHRYYSDDPLNSGGYLAEDCDWYKEPVYVPPAAPEAVRLTELYKLDTTVMTFDSANDAYNKKNAKGTYSAGSYIVYEKADNGMVNLTKDNMKAGMWVNPKDNVKPESKPVEAPSRISEVITKAAEQLPAPTPAPVPTNQGPNTWRVCHALRPDGKPVLFQSLNTVPLNIKDYEGKQADITMQPYNQDANGQPQPIPVVSYFEKEDETGRMVRYARTQRVAKEFWFYGIDFAYLEQLPDEQQPWFQEPKQKGHGFDYNGDGVVNAHDFTDGIQGFIDYGSRVFKLSVDGIRRISKTDRGVQGAAYVTKFTKGVIDGFTKRKVKK